MHRIAAFSPRHPALAVVLALLATLGLGIGALRVGSETGDRALSA